MIRALSLRLGASVLSILLVLIASFALLRMAPGGPFDQERSAPPEVLERLEARYGLDQPWPTQLIRYLGGVLRGDLGPSYQYPDYSVSELISAALPLTLGFGGQWALFSALPAAGGGTSGVALIGLLLAGIAGGLWGLGRVVWAGAALGEGAEARS